MSIRTSEATLTTSVSGQDMFLPVIPDYFNYLRRHGLSEKTISGFSGPAKHFIIWLKHTNISLGAVDDAVVQRFFQHDCMCPRPRGSHHKNHVTQSRVFKSKIYWFIRFLEESGINQNPVSLNEIHSLLKEFTEYLLAEGYASGTVLQYRNTGRHFASWLHRLRIPLEEVTESIVVDFINHDCICPNFFKLPSKQSNVYISHLNRFVRFLIVRGIVPGVSPMPKVELSEDMTAFRIWLRQHRGIIEPTIERHIKSVGILLLDLGHDPRKYNAALIRRAILRCFKNISRASAQLMAGSLRMYLRFLVTNGRCPESLIKAVPTIPRWRLSTLPRYILKDDVERVIASCDVTRPKGMRDRAIMLLLARLALRGGDIVCLCLDDIDWENSIIQVSGKTRHSVGLPLPQDVGDAILSYIEHARPRVDEKKIFLGVNPPYRPFLSSSPISGIVQTALKRAGIENVNLRGAHLLRHSAATNMLRSGATLEAVGTLLRHQSAETTAIYAKVDIPMLQKIVQPWIGDIKC